MKSVLITGATRGIGLETAKQLSKKGLLVYLGTRNLAQGVALVTTLQQNGYSNIKAIEIDVTNASTILSAKNIIEEEQGLLDILINNAGILGSYPIQSAQDTPAEDIAEVFNTNLFGAIRVTQAMLALLKKSAAPRISNITSGLASLTLHSDAAWKYYHVKTAGYGPSKTALNAYTVALAYELRDLPFKVSAIDPGYTSTDFNHHSGPLTVESAASFVIKHTLTDEHAPTGKFYSNDIEDENGISPW